MMTKTRFVEFGKWETVERLWGRGGRAVFIRPARAEIKVRYGVGWLLGQDRQQQTLNGTFPKELKVGAASIMFARMQILMPRSVDVTYEFYRGESAGQAPVRAAAPHSEPRS